MCKLKYRMGVKGVEFYEPLTALRASLELHAHRATSSEIKQDCPRFHRYFPHVK